MHLTLVATSKYPIVAFFWLEMFVRYPFLALEIFNCEISSMLEKFFEPPEVEEEKKEEDTPTGDDDDVIMDDSNDDVKDVNGDDDEVNTDPKEESEEDKEFQKSFDFDFSSAPATTQDQE